jgi:hypothetical protein
MKTMKTMKTMKLCYISLGGDCSVSYNLRRLGLQMLGTMPFDWARIDKLSSIIAILESGFQDIADFNQYNIKQQSDNFIVQPSIDNTQSSGSKSRVRLVHKVYKLVLPHEYNNNELDVIEFEERYSRRIARFMNIGKCIDIKKVYVRLGTRNEVARLEDSLVKVLNKLGFCNYEVKFIILDEWESKLEETTFTWQRQYIPWDKIFT